MPKINRIQSIQEACLILGVYPDCSLQELKRVYRQKVLQYHPDRNPDVKAHEKFLEITEAFTILADPELREKLSRIHRQEKSNEPKQADLVKSGERYFSKQEFDERIRRAKEAANLKAHLHLIQFEEVRTTWMYKLFPKTSVFFILFGIMILTDFLLTTTEYRYVSHSGKDNEYAYIHIHDSQGDIPIMTHRLGYQMERGDMVIVKRTMLFGQVLRFSVRKDAVDPTHAYPNYLQIHIILAFVLVVMMLPLLSFITHGPKPAFYFFLKVNFWLPLSTLTALSIVYYINSV